MDRIAQAVGLSPVEIRRRNFLKPGQTTTTEQTIREEIDLGKLLDRALELSDYTAKKTRFAQENENQENWKRVGVKKGMGIAAFLHGAGFTGSGERYLASVVAVEGCADGTVRVLVSSTEFGQGTNTVLCQIAAEALGLPYEDVRIAQPDTNQVPNSGPTVASRTAMVVGSLVRSAALGIKQTLIASGLIGDSYSPGEFRTACREYIAAARRAALLRALRSSRRSFLGRSEISRRSLCFICLGGLCCGSRRGSFDLQCNGRRFRGLAGSRQSSSPRSGARAKSPVASRRESDLRSMKKSSGKMDACRMAR